MAIRLLIIMILSGMIFFVPQSLQATDRQSVVRFATYNVSLYRHKPGELIQDLRGGHHEQARQIAEMIQRVRPDVLLLNEFDYDEQEQAAQLLCADYLQVGQNGQPPILYPYYYCVPVNTGVPSHLDLDRDGRTDQPNDAFGFGRHPGQYGMLLLSRYPIQVEHVRTFQNFLWKDMPKNLLPVLENSTPYYTKEALAIFRLSSKSHWDVPVTIGTKTVHVLAAHPTPPTFDGPEKRNGRRNHDEIRLWADYIDPARSQYLYDDQGHQGGLEAQDRFVILGDYNADPFDGDSVNKAARQLLDHPLIDTTTIPASEGAAEASQDHANQNRDHHGPAAYDTANFSSGTGPGNLRVDYVLPSRTLTPYRAGVFWPKNSEDGANLLAASDHHLVWIDVMIEQ